MTIDKDNLCNWCGLTCKFFAEPDEECYGGNPPNGLINPDVMGGYSSTPGNGDGALDDMTSYRFSICEFCLNHLFDLFKIPPFVDPHDDGTMELWVPAQDRVIKDDWRKTKEKFFNEFNRRNEARNKK